MKEWMVLLNAMSAIFQPYCGEKMLTLGGSEGFTTKEHSKSKYKDQYG